jgi:hypothetical protein
MLSVAAHSAFRIVVISKMRCEKDTENAESKGSISSKMRTTFGTVRENEEQKHHDQENTEGSAGARVKIYFHSF